MDNIRVIPQFCRDIPTVRALNETAFGQPAEAGIVDSIRTTCPDAVSLVAVDNGQVVGSAHSLSFSVIQSTIPVLGSFQLRSTVCHVKGQLESSYRYGMFQVGINSKSTPGLT